MKKLIGLVAMVSLVLPSLPRTACAGGKPLPPAFGKELVPDSATEERNEDKAAEIEEEKAQEQKHPRPHPVRAPHEMRGKKLHIELDGDEDGGGIDDEGDDGGDF